MCAFRVGLTSTPKGGDTAALPVAAFPRALSRGATVKGSSHETILLTSHPLNTT